MYIPSRFARECAAAGIMVECKQEESTVAGQEVLPVIPDLVWENEIPDDGYQDEAFRRWYVARVLTRGRLEGIRELGLLTIYAYLPHLVLPDRVRRFWEWYFGLPDVRARHGFADSPAA